MDVIQLNDIVEIPALKGKDGSIQFCSLELQNLSREVLKGLAQAMGCAVSYPKVRVAYVNLEDNERLCDTKGCWRPAKTCESHSLR
jgi:hypothetical protein